MNDLWNKDMKKKPIMRLEVFEWKKLTRKQRMKVIDWLCDVANHLVEFEDMVADDFCAVYNREDLKL